MSKNKEKFTEIKIDLSSATNEAEVNKIVASSINLSPSYDGTIDTLIKEVDNLETNIVVSIKNPTLVEEKLLRYVLIIKDVFFGRTEALDEKRQYSREIFRDTFLIFIFYSFIGWIVENFVEIVINGWTYMPREFLRGPICPIFGIGAIVLLVTLDKPLNNNVKNIYAKCATIFIESTIITSIIEFLTSYYLEYTTGTWPWKGYANQIFNLGGRIALANSLGFGLISTICLVFIQPKVMHRFNNMRYDKVHTIIFYIIWILFLLDVIFAIMVPTGVRLDVPRQSWR